MMRYYPVNLDIAGRPCAVIGGGAVAERKVASLVAAGGMVTVISPELTARLEQMKNEGRIAHIARNYAGGDLAAFAVVICATADAEVNRQALAEARAVRALVNVVDAPELCDFIVPAQVVRGDLQITVSTGGKSPVLARRLREELENRYGGEYGAFLDFVAKMRGLLPELLPETRAREHFWRTAIDQEIMQLLQQGRFDKAKEKITHAISRIGIES